MNKNNSNSISKLITAHPLLTWIVVVLFVYFLVLAVGMIGSGFKWLSGGSEGARNIFAFANNPFMGLLMGILATSLIQSSSTVTSVIVGLCAGGLPINVAVPMIMGANVGTTVTNTLVSLGSVRNRQNFKRALAAATIHDFFNILAVIIFLPIEILFQPLQRIASFVTDFLTGSSRINIENVNFIAPITKPVIELLKDYLATFPLPIGPILLILIGIALIFLSILKAGDLLKAALVGRAEKIFHNSIGKGPLSGILMGTIITILVQSSSTTTSLIIPLAAAGIIELKKVYPFSLGANIGTTITALLATTAFNQEVNFALQIALVHFFYNFFAVIVIYSIPFLRFIPIACSENLAEIAVHKRRYAIFYVLFIFFIVPLIFAGASQIF